MNRTTILVSLFLMASVQTVSAQSSAPVINYKVMVTDVDGPHVEYGYHNGYWSDPAYLGGKEIRNGNKCLIQVNQQLSDLTKDKDIQREAANYIKCYHGFTLQLEYEVTPVRSSLLSTGLFSKTRLDPRLRIRVGSSGGGSELILNDDRTPEYNEPWLGIRAVENILDSSDTMQTRQGPQIWNNLDQKGSCSISKALVLKELTLSQTDCDDVQLGYFPNGQTHLIQIPGQAQPIHIPQPVNVTR